MEKHEMISVIKQLQAKVEALESLLRFHKLDKIPLKYRKAFPKEGEHELFWTDKFQKEEIYCEQLDGRSGAPPIKLTIPADPNILNAAKERMNKYKEEAEKTKNETYFILYQDGEEVRETLSEEEAIKWEKEGEIITKTFEFCDPSLSYEVNRNAYEKTWRKVRPIHGEALPKEKPIMNY